MPVDEGLALGRGRGRCERNQRQILWENQSEQPQGPGAQAPPNDLGSDSVLCDGDDIDWMRIDLAFRWGSSLATFGWLCRRRGVLER